MDMIHMDAFGDSVVSFVMVMMALVIYSLVGILRSKEKVIVTLSGIIEKQVEQNKALSGSVTGLELVYKDMVERLPPAKEKGFYENRIDSRYTASAKRDIGPFCGWSGCTKSVSAWGEHCSRHAF